MSDVCALCGRASDECSEPLPYCSGLARVYNPAPAEGNLVPIDKPVDVCNYCAKAVNAAWAGKFQARSGRKPKPRPA